MYFIQPLWKADITYTMPGETLSSMFNEMMQNGNGEGNEEDGATMPELDLDDLVIHLSITLRTQDVMASLGDNTTYPPNKTKAIPPTSPVIDQKSPPSKAKSKILSPTQTTPLVRTTYANFLYLSATTTILPLRHFYYFYYITQRKSLSSFLEKLKHSLMRRYVSIRSLCAIPAYSAEPI
jgi:hypothetical protein